MAAEKLSKFTNHEQLRRQYQTEFSPMTYLEQMYQKPTADDVHSADYLKFIVSSLHRIFTIEIPDGDSILDFGCGPTISCIISASDHYKHVVSAEFLEQNRQEVEKWMRNDAQAFDWSYALQMVASLEKETDYRMLKNRVQSRLEEVIPCDIMLSNPIEPVRKTFDVVVTSLCLEVVATDFHSYKKLLANVASLVAPKGYLIVASISGGTYYVVGESTFAAFYVEKKIVDQAMDEIGLDVLLWLTQPIHKDDVYSYCTDCFVALAKKRN